MVSYSQTGMPIYKAEDQFDPDKVIYSNPSDAQMGLSEQEVQDFRRTFQGGIFNPGHTNAAGDFIQGGYQVHDEALTEGPYRGRYMTPVIGEGVYQPDPEGVHPQPIFDSEPAPQPVAGGDGAWGMSDIFNIQSALQGANFGDQTPIDAMSLFDDAGGGTYDVRPGSPYSGLLTMSGAGGEAVPIQDFERVDTGEKYTKRMINEILRNRFRGIDESGGDGDSAGDE